MDTYKSVKTLELYKILEMLADIAVSDEAKDIALNLLPMTELHGVVAALAETTAARQMLIRLSEPSFSGLTNIVAPVNNANAGSSISMRDLLDIACVLKIARRLKEYFEKFTDGDEICIKGYFNALSPNYYLEKKIFDVIIDEEHISDNASSVLSDVRRKIAGNQIKIRESLNKLIHGLTYQKYLQEPVISVRNGRYVVPVKAEFRSEVNGIVHDVSSSGSTFFVEPSISVELSNEIRILQTKEETEIERILSELSSEVALFSESITANYTASVKLDFLFAKATLSRDMNAISPDMNEDGIIDIKQARHPLIDNKRVVPIDVKLGGEFDTLVITGPNTGGKTVTIKTLGLFTLITQCGLHIPAREHSKMSVFKNIFADIGDEQSIEQSLSTFSSHMKNIVDVIKNVDAHSLVLFDELGAGTDPIEGAALAVSILEEVRSRGAKTAATTHYAELKVYALTTEFVENASCEFNVETLQPTYRLLMGLPGKSNAFAISKRLGLDKEIIERAKSGIDNGALNFEEIVAELQATQFKLDEELKRAERLRYEAEKEKNIAESERKDADKSFKQQIERKREEAERILIQAKRVSEDVFAEISTIKREKEASTFENKVDDLRFELKNKMKSIDDIQFPKTEEPKVTKKIDVKMLKTGMDVEIPSLGKRGTLATLPDNSGNVQVQIGNVKLKTDASSLIILDKNTSSGGVKSAKGNIQRIMRKKSDERNGNTSKNMRDVRTELDLRGMTADEAVIDLGRFIDDAVMMNLGQITVVHGKGTGVLRNAVAQELRTMKYVKSFRLGIYGEGESGVTIVELQ